MSRTLSVVIPAYQEQERIVQTLNTLLSFLGDARPQSEVIVVSGGSTDRTADIAREFAQDAPVDLKVVELRHSGKGAAVRAGVAEASGQCVLFTDADCPTPPNFSPSFYNESEMARTSPLRIEATA